MPHPTEAQIEDAIAKLRRIIDAAENSNHAGEVALMKAAAAGEMFTALERSLHALTVAEDHGILGGGEMARKYNMNPMQGYDFVLRRVRSAMRKVRAAIDTAQASFPNDEPEPADPEAIAAREHADAENLTAAGRGHLNARGF